MQNLLSVAAAVSAAGRSPGMEGRLYANPDGRYRDIAALPRTNW